MSETSPSHAPEINYKITHLLSLLFFLLLKQVLWERTERMSCDQGTVCIASKGSAGCCRLRLLICRGNGKRPWVPCFRPNVHISRKSSLSPLQGVQRETWANHFQAKFPCQTGLSVPWSALIIGTFSKLKKMISNFMDSSWRNRRNFTLSCWKRTAKEGIFPHRHTHTKSTHLSLVQLYCWSLKPAWCVG